MKHPGILWELEGDREGPIYRNNLDQDEDVLSKGREIIKMYAESDFKGTFSLMALNQMMNLPSQT